jgi:hypothetical protein
MYMLSSLGDSAFSFQGLSVAVITFLVRKASGAGVDVGSCILACGRTSDTTERNYVLRRTFSWLSHLYTYITEGSMWCEELAVNWCFITKCVDKCVHDRPLWLLLCLNTEMPLSVLCCSCRKDVHVSVTVNKKMGCSISALWFKWWRFVSETL